MFSRNASLVELRDNDNCTNFLSVTKQEEKSLWSRYQRLSYIAVSDSTEGITLYLRYTDTSLVDKNAVKTAILAKFQIDYWLLSSFFPSSVRLRDKWIMRFLFFPIGMGWHMGNSVEEVTHMSSNANENFETQSSEKWKIRRQTWNSQRELSRDVQHQDK